MKVFGEYFAENGSGLYFLEKKNALSLDKVMVKRICK